ncbi:GDSL-type esterase/lipase family protein [Kribbella deserti]|uniref:GDSL-type esterase/lipase family protein n=1 Tax=Kribbella deserti TaxID=1926257 RepID=A0ABV6QM67_9ACTN
MPLNLRPATGVRLASVLASVLTSVLLAAGPAPSKPAASAVALKVMPMGSSTTAGSIPGGYRSDLYWMLTSAGRPVDFVGAVTDTGPAQLPDRDHEGHGGYVIDQLTAIATARMQTYQPDAVLLHAGANDVLQNRDLANAPTRLETLIDTLLAVKPDAAVYVSTVGPLGDPAANARAATYNNAIAWVVQKKIDQGRTVKFVDLRGALLASDVGADKIHLTHSGNTKLASRWYAALAGTPIARVEAETATFSPAVGGTAPHAASTPNASANGKAGWIDEPGEWAEVTVNAPYAGAFRIFVRGGNGTTTPCAHTLTVNGGQSRTITYPPYGWENWTVQAQDVTLTAGPNKLRFAKHTCYAELDSIDLTLR